MNFKNIFYVSLILFKYLRYLHGDCKEVAYVLRRQSFILGRSVIYYVLRFITPLKNVFRASPGVYDLYQIFLM